MTRAAAAVVHVRESERTADRDEASDARLLPQNAKVQCAPLLN